MKHLRLAILASLGVLAASALGAQVITAPPLSGNFALTLSGFELVTPAGSASLRLDIKGEGLVVADGSGNLSGSETFNAANPAVPEIPSGTVSAPCAGALGGTIAEPGDGTAQIQLQFTPSTPPPAGVGAQDACVPTAITLNCVEILPNFYFPPVAATGSAGQNGIERRKGGKNPGCVAPMAPGPKGCAPGTPIAFPPYFFPSGANSVKCVATSVATSATTESIDGATLSMDMQQTAPASFVLPTPEPGPTAVPLPSIPFNPSPDAQR